MSELIMIVFNPCFLERPGVLIGTQVVGVVVNINLFLDRKNVLSVFLLQFRQTR